MKGAAIRRSSSGRARWGPLEVHHVVRCAQGGSDFDLDRLVALCPPCHAQTDAPYARGRLVITPLGDGRFTSRLPEGLISGRSARSLTKKPGRHPRVGRPQKARMNELSPEFTRSSAAPRDAARKSCSARRSCRTGVDARDPIRGHQESEGPGPGRRRPPRGPSWARWIGPGGRQARPGARQKSSDRLERDPLEAVT